MNSCRFDRFAVRDRRLLPILRWRDRKKPSARTSVLCRKSLGGKDFCFVTWLTLGAGLVSIEDDVGENRENVEMTSRSFNRCRMIDQWLFTRGSGWFCWW